MLELQILISMLLICLDYEKCLVVEIALAKARKDDSKVQIKDKQNLFHALTNRDTKILEQSADTLRSTEYQSKLPRTRQGVHSRLFHEDKG